MSLVVETLLFLSNISPAAQKSDFRWQGSDEMGPRGEWPSKLALKQAKIKVHRGRQMGRFLAHI